MELTAIDKVHQAYGNTLTVTSLTQQDAEGQE